MSKIKLKRVCFHTFDCIYCSDLKPNGNGVDIQVPKDLELYEEKFYRIKCPECGKVNYVLPVINIEPVPFTYEDYKCMKDDKERVLLNIYSSYQ